MRHSIALAIAAVLILSAPAWSGEEKKPEPVEHPAKAARSALASSVVRSLGGETSQWDLSRFPKTKRIPANRPFERVEVPAPLIMSDGFSHTLFLDHALRNAWVHRTGGYLGVGEFYGPIRINSKGVVIFPSEVKKGQGKTEEKRKEDGKARPAKGADVKK